MNRARPRITGFQHGMLIVGALVANGIFSLPRVAVQEGGRSAPAAVAGAGVAVLILALLTNRLAACFPGQDPSDWAPKLLGPFFGRVWLVLYVIKSCLFVVVTMHIYAGVITNRMLVHTPANILAAVVLVLSVLAVLAGINGLARFAELSVMLWVPMVALLAATALRGHTFNLQPMIGDVDLGGFLLGAKAAAYSYAGYDILLFSYPHLEKPRCAMRAVAWSVVAVAAVYTLTTAGALAFFGVEYVTRLLVPTLVMLSIPETSVIERFDSLALFWWMGVVVVTSGTQFYIGTRALQGLVPHLSLPKTAVFLGGFLLVASWGETPLRELVALADIFGMFDMIFIALSVVLLLPLAYVTRRRVRQPRDE